MNSPRSTVIQHFWSGTTGPTGANVIAPEPKGMNGPAPPPTHINLMDIAGNIVPVPYNIAHKYSK